MVKDSNVRIVVTLTKEELSLLEMVCNKYGLSKSAIIKILIQEKKKKWTNALKV